ncbi:MAG: Lyzozyme M1 (1,4-beta-N-acetylmuramidase), partial [Lachnospira sp.]|nr:Lyzozyme M1 (1,4-beta-N-acetylmuramidase) [Lachnospira sp.]
DVGVYFFSQAITEAEAIEEADYICDKIRGYNINLPVVYDTEYLPGGRHNNLTRAQRTKVAKAFCNRVIQRGYTPMIYGSTSWLNNDLDMSQLKGYKIWVAQYYSSCQYTGSYDFWQYSSSGTVPGINGGVDMNYWYTGGMNY